MENKTETKFSTINNNTNNTNNTNNNMIKKDVGNYIQQLKYQKYHEDTKHFIIESRDIPKPLSLSTIYNKQPESVKLI